MELDEEKTLHQTVQNPSSTQTKSLYQISPSSLQGNHVSTSLREEENMMNDNSLPPSRTFQTKRESISMLPSSKRLSPVEVVNLV